MYRASIENRGDARFHATVKGHSFVLGPEGQGASAGDTLVAALCGCIGHYTRLFLRERRVAFEGFGVSAEAESTADQSRLARIDVRIDLGRTELDEQRRAELLTYVERCKLHNTLKAGCTIAIALAGREAGQAAVPIPG